MGLVKCTMRRMSRLSILVVAAVLVAPMTVLGALAVSAATSRVSVSTAGAQGNSTCDFPSVSGDGRYVAFLSESSNLVSGDTNGKPDLFVRDRTTSTTARVSVSSAGGQAGGFSLYPSISADGRFVAFESDAPNLVAGDTNETNDVFVHDRTTGATTRVSVDSAGAEAGYCSAEPSISGDGRYVAFTSIDYSLVAGDENSATDIFVRDRTAGTTTRVSVASGGAEANAGSGSPSISADGRYVVFSSLANNLVAGDTNGVEDIFRHDRDTGTTIRLSVDSAGAQGDGISRYPSISADGRYVAFDSIAANLVAGDSNGKEDVFVHDCVGGATTRVGVESADYAADPFFAGPVISGDGRYVAFVSDSAMLVPGDANAAGDVFVHDRTTGMTSRQSLDAQGRESLGGGGSPSMSQDGSTIAFVSSFPLVSGDTNGWSDIYVRGVSSALPAPTVGTPVAPATMSHSKSYTVRGSLIPRHLAGTSPVRIYKWKQARSGAWKSQGYVKAKVADSAAGSTYSVKLKLASAGKWRVRAYAPADADHAAAWSSGYDYVKVK